MACIVLGGLQPFRFRLTVVPVWPAVAGYLQGAMERHPRPRFLHGSWRRPGGLSSRSTSSSSNLRAVVQDAGVASPHSVAVGFSGSWSMRPQVSSTPSSRRRKPTGTVGEAVAGNPAILQGSARPTLAALNESVTLGAGCVGAPTPASARPIGRAACHAVGSARSSNWCWWARAHFCISRRSGSCYRTQVGHAAGTPSVLWCVTGRQGPPQPAMALASRASGRAGLGRQRRGRALLPCCLAAISGRALLPFCHGIVWSSHLSRRWLAPRVFGTKASGGACIKSKTRLL